jgi:hypothetical protein
LRRLGVDRDSWLTHLVTQIVKAQREANSLRRGRLHGRGQPRDRAAGGLGKDGDESHNRHRWDRRRVPIVHARLADLGSDGDLSADLDNLIRRQLEEIGHMRGVAFHCGEERLLPPRQPLAVGSRHHCLGSDVID